MATQEELLLQKATANTEQAQALVGSATPQVVHGRVHVYKPRGRFDLRVTHIFRYRRTILHFGWVFVTRKTRGMWLGLLWVPLRPAMDMLSRGLVFGGFLGVASGDRPYLVFLTVGSAAWVFFERAAYWSFRGPSIHRRVLTKTQLPYVTVVVAAFIPAIVEAFLYALTAIITLFYFLFTRGTFYLAINSTTLASVIGFLLLALYAVGWGSLTAALVMKVPDLRFALRYFLSFVYYLTPVLYASQKIPEKYRALSEYNPLTPPIELFKYGLLGTGPPTAGSMVSCVIVLAVLLPVGLFSLSRVERSAHSRL